MSNPYNPGIYIRGAILILGDISQCVLFDDHLHPYCSEKKDNDDININDYDHDGKSALHTHHIYCKYIHLHIIYIYIIYIITYIYYLYDIYLPYIPLIDMP